MNKEENSAASKRYKYKYIFKNNNNNKTTHQESREWKVQWQRQEVDHAVLSLAIIFVSKLKDIECDNFSPH